MGIKRIGLGVIAVVIAVGAFLALRPTGTSDKTKLRVCTWSNYYPENVLANFTKKTGIEVELSYISSNEELFSKLRAGATGYDIIQPSDYMVLQMNKLGMLAPLDHAQLANLPHLDDFYKNLPYDPGFKVSVPFTWGTTGIAVNTAKVTVPADGVTWDFLFNTPDPKHTSVLDDMREVFSAALFWKGKPIDTKDQATLLAAKDDIVKLKNRILMFSSEPRPLLLRDEISVAHIFSTDAIQAAVENPKIQYFIPKEGGIVWTENFSIPKSAKHTAEAHTFINYFLDPENAYEIITQNHLATPNKTAKLKLPPEIQNNPNLYPPAEVMSRLKFLDDAGDTLNVMSRLWTELKT